MTAVAGGGETIAWETYNMTLVPDQVMMQATTAENAVVVTASHAMYRTVAERSYRTHESPNLSNGERRGSWHLNTVNNRHSVMKGTLNHFHRGVATKYLDNYMNWFSRQQFSSDKRVEPDFIGDQLPIVNS